MATSASSQPSGLLAWRTLLRRMDWRMLTAPILVVLILMMLVVPLPERERALLLVFGALPPAVLNYMFAERYSQEPEKVASMVLLGNVAAVLFLPVALAISL